MRSRVLIGLFAALFAASMASAVRAADSIKIAFIDPLSGPFANVGESEVRHFQLAIEAINGKGGVLGGRKLELVTFDSKSSPQEAVLALKQVIDQDIHFVLQGNGSNIAHAIVDSLVKHNARNPEQAVVFLNFAAVDPALTNEKCMFWHFRFDADADMKMSAITDALAADKNVNKVYLLNQDYAFGQAVSRAAKTMIAKKRPDIEIVGDELHPLGKVKDFAPYIAKIRASGAQGVISGNWGNDLTLLIKASKEAGLKVEYYTYYGGITGTPPAIGESGVEHLKTVATWSANSGAPRASELREAYRNRFKGVKDDYFFAAHTVIELLVKAIEKAKSADPLPVAKALEGLKHAADTGEVYVREDNHQVIQTLFISTFAKLDAKTKFDAENTGYGFRVDKRIEPKDTVMPTTCKMERP